MVSAYVMSVESVMMINVNEMIWEMTRDLFKIDEMALIDGEIYDIFISINPIHGIVFRDNMGYPVYNKKITLKGGF